MAFAVVWAVLLVTQPPQVKPMITVSNTAAKQNQNAKVFVGRVRLQRSPRLAMIHLPSRSMSPLRRIEARSPQAECKSDAVAVGAGERGPRDRVNAPPNPAAHSRIIEEIDRRRARGEPRPFGDKMSPRSTR
jgi:hypothetical protein